MLHSRRMRFDPRLEVLDERWLPSVLTPAQVVHAYGLDQVAFASGSQSVIGDGSGQTIAIVVAYHDPYLANDLKTFNQTFGLPDVALTQVYNVGTASNSGWAIETALDVQWAHAMAPKANLVVVEARSSSLSDMLSAVNTARGIPGVSVVSMSWGSSEFSTEKSYDTYFTTPTSHTGVTFVAASGDNGAGAMWPAVSPNVLAVGGTTLNVTASGNYVGETAWAYASGGFSRYESKPSYQSSVQTSSVRTVPDVAAVADPNTGLYVYSTSTSTGQGSWYAVGGTSASAPIWAGLIAVVNQGRALAGLRTLDSRNETLPAIYAAPTTAFHDVTSGSNGYRASTGYDLVTGRGSPVAPALVKSLVAWGTSSTTVAGSGTSTTNGTGNGGRLTLVGRTGRRVGRINRFDMGADSGDEPSAVTPAPTTSQSTSVAGAPDSGTGTSAFFPSDWLGTSANKSKRTNLHSAVDHLLESWS